MSIVWPSARGKTVSYPNRSGSCGANHLCLLSLAGNGFAIFLEANETSVVSWLAPQKANEAAQAELFKHTVIPPSRLEGIRLPPLARLTQQLLLTIMRLKLRLIVVHRR